jgi:mono/diheme cytochrome c family protein
MLTDDDVLAIRRYLASLAPVRQANLPNTFSFPFNQRWLMAIWGALFNREPVFRPVADRDAQWNRGAYLVEAAGHCGECHTPRTLMQAMNTRQKFAGGAAEGWNAYNITGDQVSGIGAWSSDDLVSYLARGHAPQRGVASGPMAEVVSLSTGRLTPSDVAAIAAYLRTIPSIRSSGLPAMAGPANPSLRKARRESSRQARVRAGVRQLPRVERQGSRQSFPAIDWYPGRQRSHRHQCRADGAERRRFGAFARSLHAGLPCRLFGRGDRGGCQLRYRPVRNAGFRSDRGERAGTARAVRGIALP